MPLLVVTLGVASASGGCGTTPADENVYINCVLPSPSAPYSTYTDGQQVDLSMGVERPLLARRTATAGPSLRLECEYNNGTGARGRPSQRQLLRRPDGCGGLSR